MKKLIPLITPIIIYILLLYYSMSQSEKHFLQTLNDDFNVFNFFLIFELIIFLYVWNKLRDYDMIFSYIRRDNRIKMMFSTSMKLFFFTIIYLDGLYILFYHLDRLIYHEINHYLDLLNYKIILYLICGFIFEIFRKAYRYLIILLIYLLLYQTMIPMFFLIELLIITIIIYYNRILDYDFDKGW